MEKVETEIKQKTDNNITTIKLSKLTKQRLEKIKIYSRETYEEILLRILEILSICRVNPINAQKILNSLDTERKINSLK